MSNQEKYLIPAVFSVVRDAKNVLHTKFEVDITHQGAERIGVERLNESLWTELAIKQQDQIQLSEMTGIYFDEELLSQDKESQLTISLMVDNHGQENIKLNLGIPRKLSAQDTHTFLLLASIIRRNTSNPQTEIYSNLTDI